MEPIFRGLHQVAQRAEDLERAVGFYRDTLGLRFIARFDPPGLAFFDLEDTRLILSAGSPSALLYLEVADIRAACSRLAQRGVELAQEPRRIHRDEDGLFGPAGAEEWMAFFHDSEGNSLALAERRLA